MSTNPLIRALDRVTRPPILTVFAGLQALLILGVAAGYLTTREDPAEMGGHPGTGDFVAFFVGGTLVRQGRGGDLYDFAVQRAVEDSVLGAHMNSEQPYLNPPALAAVMAPSTALGYVPSFLLFTLAMVAVLLGSALVSGPSLPMLRAGSRGSVTAFLLAAGYLPVALTTFGGQNTALTLFLLAGVYGSLRSRRPIAAGIFVGLLTYKPQFALIPGLVLLARREWRSVAVAVAVGLAHYTLGALVVGIDWPISMLHAMSEQAPLQLAGTGVQQFSFITSVQLLVPGRSGQVVAVAVACLMVVLVIQRAWRISPDDSRFPAFFGLVVAADMAVSPHLEYYEAGLLALVAVLALETSLSKGEVRLGTRVLLALAYLSFPAYRLGHSVGVQPLVLILAGMLIWTLWLTREPRESVAGLRPS